MESVHYVSLVSEVPPLPPRLPSERSDHTVPVEAPRDRQQKREDSRKHPPKKKEGDTDEEKGPGSPLGRQVDIRAEATDAALCFRLKTQSPQVGRNCLISLRAVWH